MVRRLAPEPDDDDRQWVNARFVRQRRGAGHPAPYVMHPDDLPPADADLPPWRNCYRCPAPAVVILLMVSVHRHAEWAAYSAASVDTRQACRHHGDALLAAQDARWHEIAVRPVPV